MTARCDDPDMTRKSIIVTTLGRVWVTHFDTGDVSIWWPERARVGEAVVQLIDGRGKWNPSYRNWTISRVHAEPLLADIGDL